MASRRSPCRPVALALALALSAGACGSSTSTSSSGTADATEPTLAVVDADTVSGLQRTPALEVGGVTLPEVTPGSEGPFTMRAEPGRALFVFFGYTNCPDVCPTTLFDLKKALQAIGPEGERVDVAFVTVDPARDTPEAMTGFLQHFVTSYHALRTEDPAELQRAESAFLASSDVTTAADGTVEVAHTGTTYLVDPDGTVLVEWSFGTKPEVLANDLRLLLAQIPTAEGTEPADAATTS